MLLSHAGKGEGMSLTAFAAGHLVGGALWQLLTRQGEQIVYAVHWNHRKDRHLRRADLDGRFSRPSILITDACSTHKTALDVAHRDQELVSRAMATLNADGKCFRSCRDSAKPCRELRKEIWKLLQLRTGQANLKLAEALDARLKAFKAEYIAILSSLTEAGHSIAGNVLIPCDTAGRSLELALLLEHAWRVQKAHFTIVLLTPVAYSTLEFAKSQLEWMNQDISDSFNKSRANPFEFR